ncbi:MAG: FAD-binding protein [Lachnospiraceae bacterium]|nr:FAD-binding protein [Lachnospiraceae bacterium]
MTKVLIIGSGISGLTCAIECASKGASVILVSPFPSERAQSVLAAGGINAVLDIKDGDSIEQHIADTLKGGCYIAGKEAVRGLCTAAPDIVKWLESLGTVFSRDKDGSISRRAFGGQSFPRTHYAGTATGKQIVTALVMEARRYEGLGLIERRYWTDFYAGLIRDGACYGAMLYSEATRTIEAVTADAVVIATGGQNAVFGKTTGSTQCDGYAAGKLFMQGAELKNLEFIQYHPTTIETDQKKMLISEAARGEGGRLFYEENGKRVYFMEDLYGAGGNLMPRDIVSRCIYETGRQVYLDVAFLGKEKILDRIPEIYDLCKKYKDLDITKKPIPVSPSVHFFMGGLAVDLRHRTNIRNLYAVGECASIYHGANRLGGNSLLAAIYGGRTAAEDICARTAAEDICGNAGSKPTGRAPANQQAKNTASPDWTSEVRTENDKLNQKRQSESKFPVMYVRSMLADTINGSLGIVRDKAKMDSGITDVDYYLGIAGKIHYDRSELEYFNYSLEGILTLAKATLVAAESRHESRGAHLRSDYPETSVDFKASTVISYNGGRFTTRLVNEDDYEGQGYNEQPV